MTTSIEAFRSETRDWLRTNCPPGAIGPGEIHSGSTKMSFQADTVAWLEIMADRGWTVPMWPKAYGGADLSLDQAKALYEEMAAIGARLPLINMGTRMLGPTLLEYGTEAQKLRHLPVIARGGAAWCQGYSEPGAGSDLAGLSTKALLQGDQFVIHGQKIWTSGAQNADWMFCLVRTDSDAPKHQGISFVLLPMDQPGVTIKPIKLLSGSSPFCETFLDGAIAEKSDLVGKLNEGWAVGKRLLQHERSGQGGLGPGPVRSRPVGVTVDLELSEVLARYVADSQTKSSQREAVLRWNMRNRAFQLTQARMGQEVRDGKTPGAATSMFKLYGASLAQDKQSLTAELMGCSGIGWEGEGFSEEEIGATRSWLASRAVTIYGGTNEVQANIIAKRVLGLPD